MKGWLTSEAHLSVTIVAVLTHALNNQHLWPSTHVACAAGLTLIGHSYMKHRAKLAEPLLPTPPLLPTLWAWMRRRKCAMPASPANPKGPQ